MAEIKILIYTDTDKISAEDEKAPWRVFILRKLLEEYRSQFLQFKLKVINRYQGCVDGKKPIPPAPIRIDRALLEREQPDQIWFFGWFQANAGETFDKFLGSNQNELDPETEVTALREWMDERGLGVLISGDHSNLRPGGTALDPPKSFVCLGKALGSPVPRAGRLRVWNGPPNLFPREDAVSTLVATGATLDPDKLQGDSTPQKLALENVAPAGVPAQAHRLFWGRDESGRDVTIDVFPDHQHEGEVVEFKALDGDWPPFDEQDPEKKQPKPVVVARGYDKLRNLSVPVLAVYDGDMRQVGRIVADSSWHHYFDENLIGFKSDSPTLGLLGQFYRNLALYLAPLTKRQQIGREMVNWAVTHPGVLEEIGTKPANLGRLALRYLSEVATRFEVAEMFHVESLPTKKKADEFSDFPMPGEGEVSIIPPQELLIGYIVDEQFSVAAARLNAELAAAKKRVADGPQAGGAEATSTRVNLPTNDDEIIAEAIRKAFRSHHARLEQIASDAKALADRLSNTNHTKEKKMAHEACITTDTKKWHSWFNTTEDDGEIEITERGDGTLEGKHLNSGQPLLDLKCDGVSISFRREGMVDGKVKEVKYKEGKITFKGNTFIATGKFEKNEKFADAMTQGEEKDGENDEDDVTAAGDDWSAEKPGGD